MAAKKKQPARRAVRAPKPKKASAAEILLSSFESNKGTGFTTLAKERKSEAQVTEFISTGLDVLDHYVLGRGGFPVGRMSEVFGEYGCGKTALLYRCLASAQRSGGIGAVIDAEHSFDEQRAETFGIDVGSLLIAHPENLEESLEMLKKLIRSHKPSNGPLFVGYDSVASMRAKQGLEEEFGKKERMALEASIWSSTLRGMPKLLSSHRTHLMLINQVRSSMKMFGAQTTTPGGNGPKFYCSTRLQFFGGKAIKNSKEEHIGKIVTVTGVKNRMTKPFQKARIRFDYDNGYINVWSTLEHAKRLGLVKPPKKNEKKQKSEGEMYALALEKLGWDFNAVAPLGKELGASTNVEVESGDEDDDDSDE